MVKKIVIKSKIKEKGSLFTTAKFRLFWKVKTVFCLK